MSSTYILPIISAVLLFPVLFALIFIPFAYRMYHRYGAFPLWRTVVFYSFLYYVVVLVFYIILPLPTVSMNFCAVHHAATIPQLRPFQFVRDIEHDTAGYSLLHRLTSAAFLQAALNVLLFVPLGVYLRYYFRRSFPLALVIIIISTLLLELTQFTGDWHLYPCAYRLFDVDDLMLNTVGGVIGYGLIAGIHFLPPLQTGATPVAHRVGIFRRLLAWVVDIIAIFIVAFVVYLAIFILLIPYNANALVVVYGSMVLAGCIFVFTLIEFVLVPTIWHGRTLGKQIVAMRMLTWEGRGRGQGIFCSVIACWRCPSRVSMC